MDFLKKTGVALITPFLPDYCIDYEGLVRIIEHQINGGIAYLVILGTTGETPVLSDEERFQLLDFVPKIVNKRIPLVAGFGGNDTAHLLNAVKQFHHGDYEAILSVSPYYNKPSQEGLYRHYKALSEISPLPVLLYNVPSRTGGNILPNTVWALAKDCKNIIGIKEASGNIAQCMDIIARRPKDFLVISGDDNLTLPFISIGMDGLISVIANAYPAQTVELVEAASQQNYKLARQLHYQLYPMMQLIFEEGSPAGIKALLHQMKLCNNIVRPPLAELSFDLFIRIGEEMKRLG